MSEKRYVNVTVAKHRLQITLAVLIGAALVATASALLWLKADNERLLQEKVELEVQLQELESFQEDLAAEGERLKSVEL